VRHLFLSILILLLTLTGCATTPSIWGTYFTPTPNQPNLPPLPPGRVSAPVPSGLMATPTLIPPSSTEQTSFASPTSPFGSAPLEPTYTPTFDVAPILYYSQSGDTLPSLARRFNVTEAEITSGSLLPPTGLIDQGTLLVIPGRINEQTTPNIQIIPDSEIIFSATALDFDIEDYVKEQGGYLSHYRDYLGSSGWLNGDEAIRRLAYDNSINPRLLLGVLEYESRWVRAQPIDALHIDYPMGYQDFRVKTLSSQMNWAIDQLYRGYYGWRTGTLTELEFDDGTRLRIDPRLNAGTVAIQYLFSRLYSQSKWAQIIDLKSGFPAVYTEMFGDPWTRADIVNPIFPPGLVQPLLVLPYEPNVEWNLTGGPHGAWLAHERDKKGELVPIDFNLAALDFAPSTDHGGCEITPTWVLAAMHGRVVRSGNGVVVIDADDDGYEQTGWNLVYLHVATKDRIKEGTWVDTNDRLGHASCEGGDALGTHIHIARKYNGEWIAADGPIPFVLSSWRAVAGDKPYEGQLINNDQTVTADPVGQKWSNIIRTK
jgi:LasA protease